MHIHRLRIVHLVQIRHRLYVEEHDFEIGVLRVRRKPRVLRLRVLRQLHIFAGNLRPLAGLEAVRVLVQHLGRTAACPARREVEDARGLLRLPRAEEPSAEALGELPESLRSVARRIPRHVEEERYRILHRLQVADVEHPEPVYAVFVRERHLLPHGRGARHVYELGVARRADVVDVVVHSPSARTAALLGARKHAHVPPVVVAQQNRHVIRRTKPLVEIVLHFLVERPHLRHIRRALPRLALDDGALVRDDGLHQLHVAASVHLNVAVSAHSDRHDVLCRLHAPHALGEELVERILVRPVVPGADLLAAARVLLVVARHRLVMRGADDYAHLVERLRVLRIVRVKRPAPHRGPDEVSAKAQH